MKRQCALALCRTILVSVLLLVCSESAQLRSGRAAPSGRTARGWRLSLGRLQARSPGASKEVHVTLADLDGDRKKELVAVGDSGHSQVWRWNGRQFASTMTTRPLLDWYHSSFRSLGSGDIDGDRKEEILLVFGDRLGDPELRAYGYRRRQWHLKLRCTFELGLMGADIIDRIVGVLREPSGGRFLVAVSHNIEDAEKHLLFYRLAGGRLQRLPYIGLGPLMEGPRGLAIVDWDRDRRDDLVLMSGGELYQPTATHPGYAPPALHVYTWSRSAGKFIRTREMFRFPFALRRLIGAFEVGRHVFLVGTEGARIVSFRWDGRVFRAQPTGIPIYGDPVACGSLLGSRNCQVVSVREREAIREAIEVSPPVLQGLP